MNYCKVDAEAIAPNNTKEPKDLTPPPKGWPIQWHQCYNLLKFAFYRFELFSHYKDLDEYPESQKDGRK